jgi:hypothetical protein
VQHGTRERYRRAQHYTRKLCSAAFAQLYRSVYLAIRAVLITRSDAADRLCVGDEANAEALAAVASPFEGPTSGN